MRSPWHNGDRFRSEAAWSPAEEEEEATTGGTTPLLVVVGPDGVVGRLQPGTIFVVEGMEGVVGALIVVVGLGNWLGGSGGSSESDTDKPVSRVNFSNKFFDEHGDSYS